MHKKVYTLIGILTLTFSTALGQVNVRDSAAQGILFNFNVGFQIPDGDVGEIYGPHMFAGVDIFYKTKSNWLIGGGFEHLFGTNVLNSDELLSDFTTQDGNIIGAGGDYVSVKYFLRGWDIEAKVGKIFPFIGPNPNSGLLVQLGAGYLQHKTKIDHFNSVFQLNPPYDKGYDQLHKGFVMSEYVGLFYAGNRRTVNFTAGLQFKQGFTQNVREYNYFSRSYDTEQKLDLYYGIKLSWFLPIYDKHAQKYYYY